MEPRKFTEQELASLVAETVSWIMQQREHHLPASHALTEDQKFHLQPFFPKELLDTLKVRDLSQTAEILPYPPFYKRVRAGGARVVPDAAHMTAMPFLDVAVFNRVPTLRTLFHTLVHVTQFSLVGLEKVMEGYFRTLNQTGLWMVTPFEEQAYQLDARYTRDPADTFSVLAEVQSWLQNGRYTT